MTISLNQVGKRYQHHWIFKGVDYNFEPGNRYALLGANGSGKSTLLRMIAGMQQCNKGQIRYSQQGQPVAADKVFSQVSYCAPGMDLVEEMTLSEFLHFHFTFKAIFPAHTTDSIITLMGLQKASNRFIHEFSSGMKQRVKLAQAFFSDTPVLLLDEPCSNLDLQGVAMYQQWLEQYSKDRLTIIASNDEREYEGVPTDHFLKIQDYHQ